MRPFVLSELWTGGGGMECEEPGCRDKTYTVYLSDEENASLPEPHGYLASYDVCQKHLGRALCQFHAPVK